MVAQENNTPQETPPADPEPQIVTVASLYRRAYNAAEDCETVDSDGVITALLAIAAEIRALRVALDGRLDLLCEPGTGYAGEPLAALRVSNMQ